MVENSEKLLIEDWRSGGIDAGDVVLVHSNLRRLYRRYLKYGIRLSPEQILQSLIEAVGSAGTLLLPLYNFDFTKGSVFDISNTPSQMGALTEAGRLHTDAVRTGHPIYSFVAIGRRSPDFANVENKSGYGEDSPFAILHQMGGKIAILDLPDQNSMTFYHYVEEMMNVPYRYHKFFRGPYIDRNGIKEEREFTLFVRDLERGITTHVNPMGEYLWDRNLYFGDRPGTNSGLRTINSMALFSATQKIISTDNAEGMLFRIEEIKK